MLVKNLRRRGFTCPDGTVYPPNGGEFEWDCRLARAGRGWASRMAAEDFVAHQHDGSTSCKRTRAEGFPKLRACGENIAAGDGTPLGALEQLKTSNNHCKNMMEPAFNKLGVGFASNRASMYVDYWTDSFGAWHYGPSQECVGGNPATHAKPGCADIDTMNCHFYRDQGLCELSPNVKRECKDTCGIGNCGGSGPSPPSPPRPQPIDGSCRDNDSNCDHYSRLGYCRTVDNVKVNCKKTCGLCSAPAPSPTPPPPAPPTECRDWDGACGYYQGQGLCGTSEHIRKYCPRACGICQPQPAPSPWSPPTPPPHRPPICTDLAASCSHLHRFGLCRWVKSVQRRCKKTCGQC